MKDIKFKIAVNIRVNFNVHLVSFNSRSNFIQANYKFGFKLDKLRLESDIVESRVDPGKFE